jgi:thioredoxin-dependent peroxiredoxin
MAGPETGQPAPDFDATTGDGRRVQLADYRGRFLVLYFYPKAFTPGCTAEAKRFRDNYEELRQLGAEVLGVSLDDQAVQCRFAERHGLRFPLIADEGGRLSRRYGVKWPLLPLARRVTFVIDPEGRIAARFAHEFQVSRHLDDVQRFLREAKGGAR